MTQLNTHRWCVPDQSVKAAMKSIWICVESKNGCTDVVWREFAESGKKEERTLGKRKNKGRTARYTLYSPSHLAVTRHLESHCPIVEPLPVSKCRPEKRPRYAEPPVDSSSFDPHFTPTYCRYRLQDLTIMPILTLPPNQAHRQSAFLTSLSLSAHLEKRGCTSTAFYQGSSVAR